MGAGGEPLAEPRTLGAGTHPLEAPSTPQDLRLPAAAQPGPGMVGGRRESEAGLGVPGEQGCADVTGRAIWLELFKKGACERRCCCTQLRPPAAATTLTATAATPEGAPEAGGTTVLCAVPTGLRPGRRPLGLQTPGELQKPVEKNPERLGSASAPALPSTGSPLSAPSLGHHGHLLRPRAPVLAGVAAVGGRRQPTGTRCDTAGLPITLSL